MQLLEKLMVNTPLFHLLNLWNKAAQIDDGISLFETLFFVNILSALTTCVEKKENNQISRHDKDNHDII